MSTLLISPIPYAWLTLVIGVVGAILGVKLMVAGRKDLNNKNYPLQIAGVIIAVWALLSVSSCLIVQASALTRGASVKNIMTTSVLELYETNAETPISESLPASEGGSIVILYKYGCPDCEAIYDDLTALIEDNELENIYFVSTRSTEGKALIEEGDIQYVPTGIYIRNTKLNDNTRLTYQLLHTYNDDDKAVIDESAFWSLVALQENGA